MADSPRSARVPGQVVVTTGHLYAFGFISVVMVALSFSVGFKVGVGEREPPSEPLVKTLLDEEARTGRLEALLMRVEQNQPPAHLVFPSRLPEPAEAEGGSVLTVVPESSPGKAEIAALPGVLVGEGVAPTSGWAVQVAATATRAEADALAAKLQGLGRAAYVVEAVVGGSPEHRVRVGGYATEAGAGADTELLKEEASSSSTLIVRAP